MSGIDLAICDRCGHAVVTATEHGIGHCPLEPRTIYGRIRTDTIELLAENAWREPKYFNSQRTYERALDESGLCLKEAKPTHSRGIDAYTLRQAEILVARVTARGSSDGIEARTLDETFTIPSEA